MDKYYGNVCELDIIFNFQKAYFILDELLLAGEMQESSKKNVLRCISQQDSLEDMEVRRFHQEYFDPALSGSYDLKQWALSYLSRVSWFKLTFDHVIRSRMILLPKSCEGL